MGLYQKLCDRIRRAARVAAGRDPSPSAAIVDTQSVPTGRQGGVARGRDPSKQVNGRKRHVITDTLGLLLGVMVGPASDSDGQLLPHLLQRLLGKVPRMKVIFADGGYEGVPGSLTRQFHVALFSLGASRCQSGSPQGPLKRIYTSSEALDRRTHAWMVGGIPSSGTRLRKKAWSV